MKFDFQGQPAEIKHGSVVLAAICSSTNTSNPSVIVGAGLVAKKACELGLEVCMFFFTYSCTDCSTQGLPFRFRSKNRSSPVYRKQVKTGLRTTTLFSFYLLYLFSLGTVHISSPKSGD